MSISAPEPSAPVITPPTAVPPSPAAPAPHEGPLGHVADWFHGHGQHAEADLAAIAADSRSFLTGHASLILDFSGDAMALLDLVDPADAALFAAVRALVPKAIAAGQSALALASAALKAA
jgi:hypothetical protein